MKNATAFSVIESNITEIKLILLFLDSLADDLILAHGSLLKFCNRIDEVERLDEAHLLPLALEIFGDHHFMQSGRYISVKKNAKSVTGTVAKRLNFDSYYIYLDRFFRRSTLRALSPQMRNLRQVFPYAERKAAKILLLRHCA